MSAVRCFVGVPLASCLSGPLVRACDAIKAADPAWRDEKWVAEENLHLTLKFLGSLDEGHVPALTEALGVAVGKTERFELPVAGIRAVPGTKRCRMLWAAWLDPDGTCASLAESVDRAALAFGIALEERAFKPHATLCRARRPRSLEASALNAAELVLSAAPQSMSVGTVTLFASRLTPRGPIYSELASWHLWGE